MLFIRHWTDSHTQIATLAVEQHEQIKAEEHSERPAGGLWAGGGGGCWGGEGCFWAVTKQMYHLVVMFSHALIKEQLF